VKEGHSGDWKIINTFCRYNHQKVNDRNDLIIDVHLLIVICKQEKMMIVFVEEKVMKMPEINENYVR